MDPLWFVLGVAVLIFTVIKIFITEEEIVVKLIFAAIIFLVLLAGYMYLNHGATPSSGNVVMDFGKTSLVWISDTFANIKSASGYVVENGSENKNYTW
jgi:hypothetical protein